MLVIKTIQELITWRNQCQFPVDLVPTMGALHNGHLSLCRVLKSQSTEVDNLAQRYLVVSIYVNPKQFDNPNDLSHYPVSLADDLALCRDEGVDMVFVPDSADMYETNSSILVSENKLSLTLCGAKRPGHFNGVCLVVSKLFNLVRPSRVAFGKKDFQQIAIIKRLIRDLSYPIELIAVETLREDDGLAMSSRNRRLSKKQREKAPHIYSFLQEAKDRLSNTSASSNQINTAKLSLELEQRLADVDAKIDYLEIINGETLESCSSKDKQALLVIACFVGGIRLIDSIKL